MDDELRQTLVTVPEIIVILFTRDFPMYSVLKIAWHVKITLLIVKFLGASTKFHEISSIFRSTFKFQEISRSCRHHAMATTDQKTQQPQ